MNSLLELLNTETSLFLLVVFFLCDCGLITSVKFSVTRMVLTYRWPKKSVLEDITNSTTAISCAARNAHKASRLSSAVTITITSIATTTTTHSAPACASASVTASIQCGLYFLLCTVTATVFTLLSVPLINADTPYLLLYMLYTVYCNQIYVSSCAIIFSNAC